MTSQTTAIGVADYAALIGRAVRAVGPAVVEGEVQNPKVTARGMLFFDLTDGDACLTCKVFSRQVQGLGHTPKHGDLVEVAVDRPDFWQQRGSLSLIVSDVRLTGEGELLRRREELLAKLREEGLCDPERRKRPPRFPRAIGVIAGRGSDGMSDVLRALQDRFPPVHVITCPATVQGKAAPRDLIDALARLQERPLVDVIIVARGGGSVQDLVAFDDERLCRAMFACEKPIVAAIGHTDNVPVCNHVTWAAFTPSRSAEMVVPSAAELRQTIDGAKRVLGALPERLTRGSEAVAAAETRLAVGRVLGSSSAHVAAVGSTLDARAQAFFAARSNVLALENRRLAACEQAVADAGAHVAELGRRLEVGMRRQLADHTRDYGHAFTRLVREIVTGARRRIGDSRRDIEHRAAVVSARDFRRRGWIVATSEGDDPVSELSGLDAGSRLRLTFSDGQADAVVDRILRDGKETT